ncbi:MAG: glycosyltransferase family 1 protein [Acidimicrobiia bacterium]|nr:glycosyltransferase family 1 protein [Acidimicrobiia bacterium]
MKVLAVCVPGAGHINPLLPLLGALTSAGDDVLVASAASTEPFAHRAGLGFRQAGQDEMAWFHKLQAHIRGTPGDGLAPDRINHYFIPRLFGEIAAADMIDDVVDAGRDFGAELVLFEPYAFAAPLAAQILDLPAVQHLISPKFTPDVLALTNDSVSPLWRSFGQTVSGNAGVYQGLTIEICPTSLDPAPVPGGDRLSLRPVSASPRRSRDRPLVYVTLGTSFANADIFRAVLAALADEAVDVLVTVGSSLDPQELGAAPANTRVERFVPQETLLPDCSVVVHHGGAGTTLGSLAYGVPQLAIPQGADNFVNASLVEGSGAGRTLGPDEVSSAAIREAVRVLLDDDAYTEAARRVAGEIAAMPAPDETAAVVRSRYGG